MQKEKRNGKKSLFQVAAEGKSKGPFHFFLGQTNEFVRGLFVFRLWAKLSNDSLKLWTIFFSNKVKTNVLSLICVWLELCHCQWIWNVARGVLLSSTEIADLYRNLSTKKIISKPNSICRQISPVGLISNRKQALTTKSVPRHLNRIGLFIWFWAVDNRETRSRWNRR